MHLLSHHNRSEFLAVPQLIRFDYVSGRDGKEPTLLIKGSTLLLKYIVLGVRLQLGFAICEGRLLYAMKVLDDGNDGGILWSVLEREEELESIQGLAQGQPLVAFLFNEIAVNVAWQDFSGFEAACGLSTLIDNAALGSVDHRAIKGAAAGLLDQLSGSQKPFDDWFILEIQNKPDWKSLQNHFITARGSSSLIDLFDTDEGNQQEQVGIWLTDNLQPTGAYHRPQRPYKENETRELTDILLSHEFGSMLIESKALSVLVRECLPDRAKLKRNLSKHIAKAFDQLRGGIRKLKDGVELTSPEGKVLSVDREKPSHAIVLIPDLDLIDNPQEYGIEFIKKFMTDTGGFAHLLDISELLRIIQAAEMIAARSKSVSPMMAFDYYLMKRAEKSVEAGTLQIEALLKIVDDNAKEN